MEEFLRDSPRESHDFQLHVQEYNSQDNTQYQDPFFDFDQASGGPDSYAGQYDAPTNTLDELILPNQLYQTISPQNQNVGMAMPAYLSPPAKGPAPVSQFGQFGGINQGMPITGIDSLNLISEDHLFSPLGSYLSPQAYLSPKMDNLDTLRLPTFALPIRMLTLVKQERLLLSPPPTLALLLLVPSQNDARLLTKEEKLKRRREFHNAVERRRRDLIKEKIKELGMIVPPLMLNPQLCAVQLLLNLADPEIIDLISQVKVKETKPNKATILNKLVDYIHHLQYVLDKQLRERQRLQQEIDALQQGNGGGNGVDTGLAGPTGAPPGPEGDLNSQFNPDDFFSDMVGSQFSDSTGELEKFF